MSSNTVSTSVVLSALLGLSSLVIPHAASAGTPDECGVWNTSQGALVECANPNDSPGPYAPPPSSVLLQQDDTGVTAQLDDGTTVDIDIVEGGAVELAVDGVPSTSTQIRQAFRAQLSDDQLASVSEILNVESENIASDTLVDILED
jgi:hypothetical protein